MFVRGIRSAVLISTVLATLGALAPSAQAAAGQVTGTVFDDANRNGAQDAGEAPFANLTIYASVPGGSFVAGGTTDSAGRYAISGLTDGNSYIIRIAPISWNSYKNDWVPTTTLGLKPERTVALPTGASIDFGLRRIQRTTDYSSPLSSYQGPNGLQTRSCDDVVTARAIYDAVTQAKIGAEAPNVTIYFDCGGNDVTTSGVGRDASGAYANYTASVWVTYGAWINYGDRTLTHEYGHAWSLYYAYIVQQDPTLSGYLTARGLTGDSRLETSHGWDRNEMIAEDYRQLFGTPNASAYAQENSEIPAAANVSGLAAYLTDSFTQPSAGSTPPAPPAPQPAVLSVSNLKMNPDPVKTSGVVSFDITKPAALTVKIVDSKGAVVRTLLSGSQQAAGSLSVTWNKLNDKGRKAGRGTYSVRVDANDGTTSATQSLTFSVF